MGKNNKFQIPAWEKINFILIKVLKTFFNSEFYFNFLFYIYFCSVCHAGNTLMSKIKVTTCFIVFIFVHNSSINEHKNMKLRENICYEMIN